MVFARDDWLDVARKVDRTPRYVDALAGIEATAPVPLDAEDVVARITHDVATELDTPLVAGSR